MFEKLDVYQNAVGFADEVASLTEAFPRGYGFLVDQWNRAALPMGGGSITGDVVARFVRNRVVRERLKSVNLRGAECIVRPRDATDDSCSAPHRLNNATPLEGDASDPFHEDRE